MNDYSPLGHDGKRSGSGKCVWMLGFLVIVLLVVVAFCALKIKDLNDNDDDNEDTYASGGDTTTASGDFEVPADWYRYADTLNAAMDTSYDPCDNFYRYACGGFIDDTVLPADKAAYAKSFSILGDENTVILQEICEAEWPVIGTFYDSCMDMATRDAAGAAPIQQYIDLLDTIADDDTMFDVLSQLHLISASLLFEPFVYPDFVDPTISILFISENGLGLPARAYYFDESYADQRAAYLEYMESVLTLLGTSDDVGGDTSDVFAFETALANMSTTAEELADVTGYYNIVSYDDFIDATPDFAWGTYLEEIGLEIPANLSVPNVDYFVGLDLLLEETPINTLVQYMSFHLGNHFANLLSQSFIDARFALDQSVYGYDEPTPLNTTCVGFTNSYFPEIVGRYFVEDNFSGDDRDNAETLVSEIEDAFRTRLPDTAWMSEDTVDVALEKIDYVTNMIGYPDTWYDYSNVVVTAGEFLASAVSAGADQVQYNFGYIGLPPNKLDWQMAVSAVNAYYDPTFNQMVFPAGILQYPFYDSNQPWAANYGSMGVVMGHELTHGFDDNGRQFDKDGRLTQWWSDDDIEAYNDAAQCLIDWYSNYEIEEGLYVNGVQTEGENIADNGGLKDAWTAYQSHKEGMSQDEIDAVESVYGYSDEQVFFISYTQTWCAVQTQEYAEYLVQTNEHAPYEARGNGPPTNYEQFATTFSCNVGTDAMAPATEDVCTVW